MVLAPASSVFRLPCSRPSRPSLSSLSGLCPRCGQPGHMARGCLQAWGPPPSTSTSVESAHVSTAPFNAAVSDLTPSALWKMSLFLFQPVSLLLFLFQSSLRLPSLQLKLLLRLFPLPHLLLPLSQLLLRP